LGDKEVVRLNQDRLRLQSGTLVCFWLETLTYSGRLESATDVHHVRRRRKRFT